MSETIGSSPPPSPSSLRPARVLRARAGAVAAADDVLAVETPVALEINGISHAVMMATPQDLEDFAAGFCLTEGVIDTLGDLYDIEVEAPAPGDALLCGAGVTVRVEIASRCQDRLVRTRRALAGRTGCGLCGTESLEQAIRLPAPLPEADAQQLSGEAIERALTAMSEHQPLSAQCGATHAAFWCAPDGRILCAREDVGRHNALDKLIGARLRAGDRSRAGFVLMTSRASYEIVQKTAVWGCSNLVTVSAPTSLAVELARRSGVCLVGFARPGRWTAYTFESRIA